MEKNRHTEVSIRQAGEKDVAAIQNLLRLAELPAVIMTKTIG